MFLYFNTKTVCYRVFQEMLQQLIVMQRPDILAIVREPSKGKQPGALSVHLCTRGGSVGPEVLTASPAEH